MTARILLLIAHYIHPQPDFFYYYYFFRRCFTPEVIIIMRVREVEDLKREKKVFLMQNFKKFIKEIV